MNFTKIYIQICINSIYLHIGILERRITRNIQKDLRIFSRFNGSKERSLGISKIDFKYIIYCL